MCATSSAAISIPTLIAHITWLEHNDFNVVSVDEILAAAAGGPPLPERSVLLTFDDGFRSVKTHVLPLLELFDYPAVVSIVTDWIESDPGVMQAGRELTREDFLSWNQVRELSEHELIEIASHSHAMHQGVVGNPQGNTQPAAVTAQFVHGEYESRDAYAARVRRDLTESAARIEQATGRRPRVMTWPFGAFNAITLATARDLGMEMTLTLTDGIGDTSDLEVIPRHLVEANPGVGDLSWSLLHPPSVPIIRAAQVDLDYVYDPDPAQQEANLGQLLDRIRAMRITHVFLQAFADSDADGGAQALYFPNHYLPMRADLFNRVAWQLKTRTGVSVYAWMPVLSFAGPNIDRSWRVMQYRDGAITTDDHAEPRLSPFSAEAREVINGIYADLARYAPIDGILFHDDGRLNEFEDFSPAAKAAYARVFDREISPAALAADAELAARWGRFRTDALIDLTDELSATVRHYRPAIRTARNLFATALLEPKPEIRLAQSFDAYSQAYDYIALMAMPRFEAYRDHLAFYEALAASSRLPGDENHRVIFELQTVDWNSGAPIDSDELRETLRMLQGLGIASLAYYPDDFVSGHPQVDAIREGMSIAEFPGEVSP
jgi:biofilm PGA synthesis lipoprotein PgaB